MIDLSQIKRVSKKQFSTNNSNISNTNISTYETISPNEKCVLIIDELFDKIVELMKKDKNISGFHKSIVVETTKRSVPGIKQYVYGMSIRDSEDIINKIRNIIES